MLGHAHVQSDNSHVEKTGEFAVKLFPEGFVLSWNCPTQMAYTFSFIVVLRKILCEFHKYHISLSHTMHDREIWGIYKRCRRMVPPQTCLTQVCACPRYEGLFHEDMSIPFASLPPRYWRLGIPLIGAGLSGVGGASK